MERSHFLLPRARLVGAMLFLIACSDSANRAEEDRTAELAACGDDVGDDASEDDSADDDGTSGDNGAAPSGAKLPPITDYEQPGPFPAMSVGGSGPDGQFTMFRPRDLNASGFKFSPLTWGNGIITTPDIYQVFLTNVASHGFVIIASNSIAVTANELRAGLEWLLEQNDQPGELQGKLDVERAVSMGYSIGGTAAVIVGEHPSVITTVSIHGHTAESGLHGPLLQTTGTDDTIGVPLQQQTFELSRVPTFLATLETATHFEILLDGGREAGSIVAWLRLFVHGDQGAEKFFYGDQCVLCVSPWTNPQRKNWPDSPP